MNIKRISAPTMREALAEIRRQLGPEAVILQNNHTASGIEVVAATDYDPALAANFAIDDVKQSSTQATEETRAAVARLFGQPDAQAEAHRPQTLAAAEHAEATTNHRIDITLDYQFDGSAADANWPSFTANSAARAADHRAHDSEQRMRQAQARAQSHQDRLDDVGAELRTLRGLVEQQLSGFAWQNVRQRNPQRAQILTQLMRFGLAPDIASEIVNTMPFAQTVDASWENAKAEIIRKIPANTERDILEHGGVVALVGPTGAGKTTTIAKLAGAFILRHGPGSVGLVTTDDYRLGAHEQLQAFGRILDISVARARDSESLVQAVRSYRGRSLVLIDTEGGHTLEQQQMLSDLYQTETAAQCFVVLSACTQRHTLARTVNLHRGPNLRGAIVTKLDECGTLGDVLSILISTGSPAIYVTDGQQVPNDLHVASPLNLVTRGEQLLRYADASLDDEVLGLALGQSNYAAAHA